MVKIVFQGFTRQSRTNIHVCALGEPTSAMHSFSGISCVLTLRRHRLLASKKKRLAMHLADDELYPHVKDPAVELIYFAAEDSAAQTGWLMGPSGA
jgi:hypothetical protein